MQEAASAAESLDLDMPVDMGPVEGRVSTRAIMDKLVFSYYAVLVEVAQRELLEVRDRASLLPWTRCEVYLLTRVTPPRPHNLLPACV